MNIAGVHIHRHVIAHAQHEIPIGVHRHIIRNAYGEVAVIVVKKCFDIVYLQFLIIVFRIVRCPVGYPICFVSAV